MVTRRARRRQVAGRQGRRIVPPGPGREAPAGVLPVQLLPHYLAAGDVPRASVGETLEVAPAIYAGTAFPSDVDGRWWVDEFGCVDAHGVVVAAMLEPGACDCRVDVLDVGGLLYPLNWAAAGSHDGCVHVEGALYLEPELEPGTPHGDAVTLCRRRFRVETIRRYTRTAGAPVSPVDLTIVPAPGEASERSVYIAGLVALPDAIEPAR